MREDDRYKKLYVCYNERNVKTVVTYWNKIHKKAKKV